MVTIFISQPFHWVHDLNANYGPFNNSFACIIKRIDMIVLRRCRCQHTKHSECGYEKFHPFFCFHLIYQF